MTFVSANSRCMTGFSYVEVLVATVLIAVALVPAIEALAPGIQGADIHRSQAGQHYHLTGKLEEVLAEPFVALDDEAQTVADPSTATAYSDAGGSTDRRLVFLSRYDADNADTDNDFFTGVDDGLIWVRIEIAGTKQFIESLVSQYD